LEGLFQYDAERQWTEMMGTSLAKGKRTQSINVTYYHFYFLCKWKLPLALWKHKWYEPAKLF